jgi:hypothetical protein
MATPRDMNKTIALQQRTVFSMKSVPRCYKQGQLGVAVSQFVSYVTGLMGLSHWELLLLEAGDSRNPQRMGNVCHWKLLQSHDREDVTADTSVCLCVCVTVYCKV